MKPLVVTHEVAKVQGGDTPEGVPYGVAKGEDTMPYKRNIGESPDSSRGSRKPFFNARSTAPATPRKHARRHISRAG